MKFTFGFTYMYRDTYISMNEFLLLNMYKLRLIIIKFVNFHAYNKI